jgi:hypothetical protein
LRKEAEKHKEKKEVRLHSKTKRFWQFQLT